MTSMCGRRRTDSRSGVPSKMLERVAPRDCVDHVLQDAARLVVRPTLTRRHCDPTAGSYRWCVRCLAWKVPGLEFAGVAHTHS